MSTRLFPRSRNAFSLVEVALAVGIISFALVAVLGLLGVGINASRDSSDDTKIAFIMQDVSARVRAEASSLTLATNPTSLDLTWDSTYGSNLNYTILGNTFPPVDSSGQPGASASAYYTADGQFVKQSTATAPTTNFYKASIYIRPLSSYPPPMVVTTGGPYPFLAVTVKVGWPTDHTVNGNVAGATNAAKSVFTFYLPKP